MFSIFLGFPVMIASLLFQMAVVSRMTILSGCGDLVMLVIIAWSLHERVTTAWEWCVIGGMMVSLVSAMPFMTPLMIYLVITGFARLLHLRIWQMPILAMLLVTLFGTVFQHLFTIMALKLVRESPIPWDLSISQVTMPSLILNLILAVPVYFFINGLANWIYPSEDEL